MNGTRTIQPPVRNASIAGYWVASHSGEFVPTFADLRPRADSLSLELTRHYRSALHDLPGAFGNGWTWSYEQYLVNDGRDMLLFDGTGRSHRFVRKPGNAFVSPPALYSTLSLIRGRFVLRTRFGFVSR